MRQFRMAVLLCGTILAACSSSAGPRAPQPTSTPTAVSAPQSLVLVAQTGGNAWVLLQAADRIARVSRNGAVRFFQLAPGSHPNSVATLGRAAWFTEIGRGRIGRIDEAGRIVEFSVPGHGLGLRDIVSTNSGLWFIESHGDRVGYVSQSGVMREFGLPNKVDSITVAANGDLLGAASDMPSIIRISPLGALRKFPLR